nr:hypothetical protein TCMXXGQR_TCMXXGQR_CDS_0003 [Microvirus sp.]
MSLFSLEQQNLSGYQLLPVGVADGLICFLYRFCNLDALKFFDYRA